MSKPAAHLHTAASPAAGASALGAPGALDGQSDPDEAQAALAARFIPPAAHATLPRDVQSLRERAGQALLASLAALGGVALCTGAGYVFDIGIIAAALVYLLLCTVIALRAGPVAALACAAACLPCLDYFFARPLFSFAVQTREPLELVTLMAFALLGLVVMPVIALLYRSLRASRAAQEALRRSEERYALSVVGSTDGLWDWDILADRMFFSDRTQEIYGLAPGVNVRTRAEWLGAIAVHPDDVGPQRQMVADYLAGKAPRYAGEWRVLGQDGRYRWFRIRGICVRDRQGRPTRLAGSVSDIDARKRAEEELLRNEAYLSQALRLGKSGGFAFDLHRNEYVHWSPESNLIYGLPEDSGLPTLELLWSRIHPDDLERMRRERDDALRRHADYVVDYRILHADGLYRDVHVVGHHAPSYDGKRIELVGILMDVTERKRAEAALLESETRFSLAVAGSSEGIWDSDRVSGLLYLSERAQELYGLTPGITTRPLVEWRSRIRFHPDDLPARERAYDDYLERNGPSLDYEFRVVLDDGQWRWLRVRGICVRDAQGYAHRLAGSLEDITQAKRAEAALLESEARFALAVAGSHQGIWDRDRITNRLYLSERAQRIYGLTPGLTVRPFEEWLAMIPFHPDDEPIRRSRVGDFVEGREPMLDCELRVRHPEGYRWVRIRGTGVRDASGYAVRLAGSVEDVDQSRRAEAALLESETRFSLAVAGSNEGIWDRDPIAGVLYLSERAQELYGLPPGATVRPLTEWRAQIRFHPDDLEARDRAYDDYINGRNPQLDHEFRVLHPDGQYRWLRVRGICVRDERGHATRMAGSLEDITARKLAEEEVQRGKDELRARQDMLDLAQKAARAVAFDWRLDATDGINPWSPELEMMYGLKAGSHDGSFRSLKKLVLAEDWPRLRDAVFHAGSTGEVAAEYRVRPPGGAIRWLQAKGRMLFNEKGEPARLVGFMFDVTDRHQAEDELRHLERQLRQAQRLESMGTLAGGIAHDFNNILGAILGYGEMAARDAAPGSRLRRDLDSIIVAGERGRALVERILTFSRSGVGERVPVHVERVIREALDLLAARLPANVRLDEHLSAGRAAMLGDPTQVHQLLTNLATNAAHAMPGGGVLRVVLRTCHVDALRVATIGKLEAGEYIVLEVMDEGSGIAPEVFERIFDPFFTTREVGVGTGLGLSLVHGIVSDVGGAIDVITETSAGTGGEASSEVGNQVRRGSTFTIHLPRAGDAPLEDDGAAPRRPRGRGERVLVVDDEEPLVRLMSQTLEELGYVPTGFTSSTQALAAFRAAPEDYDAVITDERMPGLPGHALIRELRSLREDMPILLASGYLGGSVVEQAYDAGADEVLKKPLSAHDLALALSRALQYAQAGAGRG